MKTVWAEFEHWLKLNYPSGVKDLRPPATDKEIIELEIILDCLFPEDYVECLKIHNGQGQNSARLLAGMEYLSVERVEDEWEVWTELIDGGDFVSTKLKVDKGIKNCWWNKKWIPFAYNGAGDHLCLDLDPDISNNGQVGQVITMWHDQHKRELLAPSFAVWFQQYVTEVIDGKYQYKEGFAAIIKNV